MKRYFFFAATLLCLIQYQSAKAAGPTAIKDPITQSVNWTKENSPYVIQNDVTISKGAILTVEPGTEIQFAAQTSGNAGGGPNLIIQGALKAVGNATAPIMFNPSTPGAAWGAVYFYNADSANSIMQACLIKGGRIVCNNSSPVITQSAIFGSKSGIEIGNNSQPQITGNRITANGIGIIVLSDSASPIITGNEIYNNNYGVYLKDFGTPQISANKIQGNLKYNMVNYSAKNLAVPNNSFGMTDAQMIMKTVYDGAFNSSLGRINWMPYVGMTQNQVAVTAAPAQTNSAEQPKVQESDLWSYGRPFDGMKLANFDNTKKKPDSGIKLLAVGATALLAVGLIFL